MTPRSVTLCVLAAMAGMAGGAFAENRVTVPAVPPPGQVAPDPAPQAKMEPEADDATPECTTCTARHRGLQRLQEELAAPEPK